MWEKKYELEMGILNQNINYTRFLDFMITQTVFYKIRVVTANAICYCVLPLCHHVLLRVSISHYYVGHDFSKLEGLM